MQSKRSLTCNVHEQVVLLSVCDALHQAPQERCQLSRLKAPITRRAHGRPHITHSLHVA